MLAQILAASGSTAGDTDLDRQVESMPLVVLVHEQDEIVSFLFGSLERIGGTPSILWSLGAARVAKAAPELFAAMTRELYRRAAISFPDEDVLVGAVFAHQGVYGLMSTLSDVVPRPAYTATGEERAWGRRLVKRFGVAGTYDDRQFVATGAGPSAPVVNARTLKSAAKKVPPAFTTIEPADHDVVVGFGWAMAEFLESVLLESQV